MKYQVQFYFEKNLLVLNLFQAGLEHLRRKVSGHNQDQLSFIKSNTNGIMDQLDTLRSVKEIVNKVLINDKGYRLELPA